MIFAPVLGSPLSFPVNTDSQSAWFSAANGTLTTLPTGGVIDIPVSSFPTMAYFVVIWRDSSSNAASTVTIGGHGLTKLTEAISTVGSLRIGIALFYGFTTTWGGNLVTGTGQSIAGSFTGSPQTCFYRGVVFTGVHPTMPFGPSNNDYVANTSSSNRVSATNTWTPKWNGIYYSWAAWCGDFATAGSGTTTNFTWTGDLAESAEYVSLNTGGNDLNMSYATSTMEPQPITTTVNFAGTTNAAVKLDFSIYGMLS